MDVNFSECLIRQSHWGETVVTNICSGTVSRVPWALSDWVTAGAIGSVAGLMVGMLALLVVLGVSFVRDSF